MSSAIPKGSIVLVTGISGYIASHVADQLLLAGYRVRGTVRDSTKADWVREYFVPKYGQERFETVIVPDMSVEGAYDTAIKGVSGIAHLASFMDMSSDPKVVDGVVGTILHILKAAAREPSIRRVVYTSSAAACVLGTPWCTTHIEADTYDEEAIQAVRGPRDPNMDPRLLLGHIYGASKAEAEKACWRFMKEQNPTFELNTVVPDANFGPVLYKGKATSTVSWLEKVFRGDMTMANFMGSQWFVDVRDCARLHLVGLTNPDVKSERIFAFADAFIWNQVLAIFRKAYPDRTFPENIPDEKMTRKTIAPALQKRSEELLRGLGVPGYTSLEDTVKASTESFI